MTDEQSMPEQPVRPARRSFHHSTIIPLSSGSAWQDADQDRFSSLPLPWSQSIVQIVKRNKNHLTNLVCPTFIRIFLFHDILVGNVTFVYRVAAINPEFYYYFFFNETAELKTIRFH